MVRCVSEDTYTPQVAFNELCQLWPWDKKRLRDEKSGARNVFLKNIRTEELWNKVRAAVEAFISQHDDKAALPYLGTFIHRVLEDNEAHPVLHVSPRCASVQEPQIDQEAEAISSAFRKTWKVWPRNERPEKETVASSTWRSAVARFGLADVVKAAQYYVNYFNNPTNKLIHPLHLSSFLDHDSVEEWLSRAERDYTSSDRADFDAAYSWYPDFPGKSSARSNAMAFYVRHVKPEERLEFLAACRSYRTVRHDADDDDQYSIRFLRFVGEWKETAWDIGFADLVITPLMKWVRGRNLAADHEVCDWLHGCMRYKIIHSGPEVPNRGRQALRLAINRYASFVDQADLESGVDEILAAAYLEACKPPLVVLP